MYISNIRYHTFCYLFSLYSSRLHFHKTKTYLYYTFFILFRVILKYNKICRL